MDRKRCSKRLSIYFSFFFGLEIRTVAPFSPPPHFVGKNGYHDICIISSYSLATCLYLLFKQLPPGRLLSAPVVPSVQPVAGSGQQVTRMEEVEPRFSSQFGLTETLDDLDEIEMVNHPPLAFS